VAEVGGRHRPAVRWRAVSEPAGFVRIRADGAGGVGPREERPPAVPGSAGSEPVLTLPSQAMATPDAARLARQRTLGDTPVPPSSPNSPGGDHQNWSGATTSAA
jgi:hypothetical protein